mgnify:CR=1 FL=1
MNRLIDLAERWVVGVGVLAALLLVPLVLATTWEVVSRYALHAPTIWAYEIGYTLTGAHFLLALAYTLRQGEHIRIDVLSVFLSDRARRRIDTVVYALLLPILVWVSWTLWNYMAEGFARGETSGQSALNLPVLLSNYYSLRPDVAEASHFFSEMRFNFFTKRCMIPLPLFTSSVDQSSL